MTTKLLNPGTIFNYLTIIRKLPDRIFTGGGRSKMYLCKCKCGKSVSVQAGNIRTGHSRSCGCIMSENNISHTGTYSSWQSMRHRTMDRRKPWYYGKIKVCSRWFNSYENFLADMGHRPEGTTLDRIDNNGNYEPGNCRWADKKTQDNNKSSSHYLKYKGKKQTISQWAEEIGVKNRTLFQRIYKGWSVEKALTYNAKNKKETKTKI